MIIRNERGEYFGIRCDHKDCRVMAPSSDEIRNGRGLINMGWQCRGGAHYCPDHHSALD